MTPSVYLDAHVLERAKSSFYAGKIHVSVNDGMFQMSNPVCHGAALVQLMCDRPSGTPPIVTKFSDGGTDRCITVEHVKCSMIVIFKILNLDVHVDVHPVGAGSKQQ